MWIGHRAEQVVQPVVVAHREFDGMARLVGPDEGTGGSHEFGVIGSEQLHIHVVPVDHEAVQHHAAADVDKGSRNDPAVIEEGP